MPGSSLKGCRDVFEHCRDHGQWAARDPAADGRRRSCGRDRRRPGRPLLDPVALGTVLPDRLAAYTGDGSLLNLASDPTEQSTASGTIENTDVTYGDGGVPAGSVVVPDLAGGGAGDGSVTPIVDFQSVETQQNASLAAAAASTAGQAGVIAFQSDGARITDTEGTAQASLSSDLSGVTAQSQAGKFTLLLAQALQADTVVDTTTGARSLTTDGKAALIKSVTQLLLARNFTNDEAVSGATTLANSIDGSAKTITLALQHRGSQQDSWLGNFQPGGGTGVAPDANSYSNDDTDADNIDISLDTGTGALGVSLQEHETLSVTAAQTEQVDNLGQALAGGIYQTGTSFLDPVQQDVQSAAGAVLQESSSTSTFQSYQTSLTAIAANGPDGQPGASLSITTASIQGRLRTQDIGAAAALQKQSTAALDDIGTTVAVLYQGDAKLAAGSSAAAGAAGTAARTAALTAGKPAGKSPLDPQNSVFITELSQVLHLLQSATPTTAADKNAAAAPPADSKLQSLSTSQEAPDITASVTDRGDGSVALGENNAYLAALYAGPSAAKPSTQVTA
jgi:hypothetical protein